MQLKQKKNSCDRCGGCCSAGGSALLKNDMSLFISGTLSYDNAYTIREGELVRRQGDKDVFESFMDIIKIREGLDGKGCTFYEGDGTCRIYENRPSQCRAYKCWSADDMLTGLEKVRLTRKELFSSVDVLIEAIDRHEEKCSYKGLADALERLANGEEAAVEDIMDMLQYDTAARPFLEERFHVPAGAMDLLLGRPMIQTINEFGFRVVQEGDEYIILPVETVEKKTDN